MAFIQSIVKAMNIVELLAQNPRQVLSLREIADELQIERSTCANIIKTLSSRGYVQQNSPRSGYQFGYMFYKLTNMAVENEELTKVAREDVDNLGDSLNESAILSCLRNDKRIVLYYTTPDRELFVRPNIDKSVYTANTGRVILANYTLEHLEKFIIRNHIPTKKEWPLIYKSEDPELEFRRQLHKIRKAGYEIDADSNGIVGFAAPLWRNGHVVGSIGLYMPISRLKSKEAVLEKLLDAVRSINRKLELTDKL